MKAAILTELNKPLVVDDIVLPAKLECGQVLVKVKVSGICGAQIGEISGAKGEDKYLPHLLGHEGGGIVKAIGEGVKTVEKGDHVVMHWRKGAGIEANPPIYGILGGSWVGGGWITTFNEYAVVSENRLTAIKKEVPFDIAALMGCAVTTALGLINNEAKLKIGQSVAIAGCGGVGLNLVRAARMVSANQIIAIDINKNKLNMAIRAGATHAIESTSQIPLVMEGRGIDVFIDCTGIPEVIAQGYEIATRTILVGQPKAGEDVIMKNMRNNYCGKTLMDSQGGLTNPAVDIPRYVDLYLANRLELNNIITHRFSLADVNEALDIVRSGDAGRCILEM